MTRAALLALLCWFACSGLANAESSSSREALVLAPDGTAFGPATPTCPQGTITFAIAALNGSLLGDGEICLRAFRTQCATTVFVGCRQAARGVLSARLPGGTLTVRMRVRETWIGETSLFQIAAGNVVGGTGAYAGRRGTLHGGGTATFGATIETNLVWLVLLRG
jgi:hypothetical protein